ncbi:MAG TPA: transglycosylase family protein [Solirubrobacteraceae bacterium]|nr:transglycosylase family protein [Solirubrobacteraceae bacterium]
MLTRRTAVAAAGATLATVPAAVAAASDNGAEPVPQTDGGRLAAPALAHRRLANVMRDGARQQRGQRAHRTLVTRNVRLAHKVARAREHKLPQGRTERVREYTRPRLRAENRELSVKLHRIAGTTSSSTGGGASPQLQGIAACESGGDPHSIGGGGAFRGKYQFTYGAWASVGGSGDPAAAPEAEQDKRAQMLLDKSGSSPWPVCGQ